MSRGWEDRNSRRIERGLENREKRGRGRRGRHGRAAEKEQIEKEDGYASVKREKRREGDEREDKGFEITREVGGGSGDEAGVGTTTIGRVTDRRQEKEKQRGAGG